MIETFPLLNKTGWMFSDGKAGNEAQLKGVTSALGLKVEIKLVNPQGIQKLLSPWCRVSSREHFGKGGGNFSPPWPDFAFAIGRLTTPYIRELRSKAGKTTFTVILQNPKVNLNTADLFWVPEHDTLRGPNVITTLTAPHIFTKDYIDKLRSFIPEKVSHLSKPRAAILLGGSNGDYNYTKETRRRLEKAIRLFGEHGFSLMVTPSRRTDPEIIECARKEAQNFPHFFWNMKGVNPYPEFLAHADIFLVPADSINMTGEPCVTGRPIYVFYPDGGSKKFNRFHKSLENYGATRPMLESTLALENWTYTPLNSSETIAKQIFDRWQFELSKRV
ncbi:MAG: mitochondrial fission ELM1 family protein [Hyphomicrobium sp.]